MDDHQDDKLKPAGSRVLTSLMGPEDLKTQEQRHAYAEELADEILVHVDARRKEMGLPPLTDAEPEEATAEKTASAPGLDAGARVLIDSFNKSFDAGLRKEQDELDAMPKTHDPSEGEFVEEIDPAKADK